MAAPSEGRQPITFELYRQTKMGDCLCEALEAMVEQQKITQELALAVFKQFDESILHALDHQVTGKASIKANLSTYRYFDDVWQFHLENVVFKLNESGTGSVAHAPEVQCKKAKVVCVDAKLSEHAPGAGKR